ncbi:hypothetical protein DFQ28_011382 [Apophysomyces sp. BC1034]|nr:hypothetical protein DFQ30_004115 [Apophysomyces sp. BC1015]KAG0174395.1 hypothetical protein DFQ29_007505 [Apophysomyces sp. BC1021]KAG0191622.1 hypothetical protein DFQ28_011382 [Apophysomyces sp. BC1034]
MRMRLEEFKKHIASNANEEENYARSTLMFGSMMKEINYHIDYLETIQFIPADKEKVFANFIEFKMGLLEYQNELSLHLQTKRFLKMAENLKKMTEKSKKTTHKLKEKTRECKELKAAMKSLEKRDVESQDEQRISLTSSLAIKAHLSGSPDMVSCISFDGGYTSYGQLREKIRDVFRLESHTFILKYATSAGEFNQLHTSDDYKEAIRFAFRNQFFDVPVNVIKVYIETGIESIDFEAESSDDESNKGNVSEEDRIEDNGSHSEISVPDFPLAHIQSDVRWDRPDYAQVSCYVYGKTKSRGYRAFYSIENLKRSHKGKGPFVVDDRCVVSAYVRVVEGPNMDK